MTEEEYAAAKARNLARVRSEKSENGRLGVVVREQQKAVPALLQPKREAISFEVPGVPVAKGRPRLGQGHIYTPAKTTRAEAAIAAVARIAGVKPVLGPLRINIEFWFVCPANKKRALPNVRPDLDNLCKTVLDALNGIAYKDDGQIVELTLVKGYANVPKTIIDIHEL